MKKLALVLVGIVFFAACSGKEQPQEEQKEQTAAPSATSSQAAQAPVSEEIPPCTINEHDCWEVVQLAEETKQNNKPEAKSSAQPGKSNTDRVERQLTPYKNLKLEQINLSVIDTDKFRTNKPARYYRFSNGITVFKKLSSTSQTQDWISTTVSFPTLEVYVLDKEGKIMNYTPAPDCIVNHTSCTEIALELNRFFTDKPNLEIISEKEQPEGEHYAERVCHEDTCETIFRKSDLQLIGIPTNKRQQKGDTYTYTLNDGRTVLFNWGSNARKRGYLTVTETNGTQKKFNPQGKRVN